MRALLYAPGGGVEGLGHTMRSLALAEEAMARGWQVSLTGRLEGPALEQARLVQGLRIVQGERDDLPAHAAGVDVVHIDTYDTKLPKIRGARALLSSMADAEFGLREAHLTIDISPIAPSRVDRIRERTGGEALVGPSFSPLRRSVLRFAGAWTGSGADRPQVLVVMGGTDPFGLTAPVVEALAQTTGIDVTVVSAADHHAQLHQRWGLRNEVLTCLDFANDLPSIALRHDLVVSASGISVWEFASLGIPMALICAVDNQLANFRTLVEGRAAIGLDARPAAMNDLASRVLTTVRSRDELQRLSRTARGFVDGRGANRVISSWEALLQQPPTPPRDNPVSMRSAELADSANLREWRNDATTRHFSRSSELIDRASHRRWFHALLADPDRHMLIAEMGGQAVGTVRFDKELPAPWEGRWEVSITVAPKFRGRSLALPILNASEKWLSARVAGPQRILASVHVTNSASARLFAQAGYLPDLDADEGGFFRLSRSLVGQGA